MPIEVTNDTRREREDVSVEVSEARSAGGHKLPWQVIVNPPGPLTLPPCSTTKLELAVLIHCPEPDSNGGGKPDNAKAAARSITTYVSKSLFDLPSGLVFSSFSCFSRQGFFCW